MTDGVLNQNSIGQLHVQKQGQRRHRFLKLEVGAGVMGE